MPTEPLAISDAALVKLLELAQPLSSLDRSRFLEDIAAALRGHTEIGDGLVVRTARMCQKKYLVVPPADELRRVPSSRIAGTRLSKANGNGSGGKDAA